VSCPRCRRETLPFNVVEAAIGGSCNLAVWYRRKLPDTNRCFSCVNSRSCCASQTMPAASCTGGAARETSRSTPSLPPNPTIEMQLTCQGCNPLTTAKMIALKGKLPVILARADEISATMEAQQTHFLLTRAHYRRCDPFPSYGTKLHKIRWLLDTTTIRSNILSICGDCTTYGENAQLARKWMSMASNTRVSVRMINLRMILTVYEEFVKWLVGAASSCGFDTATKFHESLAKARQKVASKRECVNRFRGELITMVEEIRGRRGCFDCGKQDDVTNRLEFDHNDPGQKIQNVSQFILQLQFERARTEALGTTLRCRPCHRKKTNSNGGDNGKGRPRLPAGDARTEKTRDRKRRYAAFRYKHHKQRCQNAKVKAGKCQECGKACTIDNLYEFEFAHIDPMQKEHTLSRMVDKNDTLFKAELAKTRLLCILCHKTETDSQKAIIAAKKRTTRKRNRSSFEL
jgi:hypothetical protein